METATEKSVFASSERNRISSEEPQDLILLASERAAFVS